jgi:hypothetical protein
MGALPSTNSFNETLEKESTHSQVCQGGWPGNRGKGQKVLKAHLVSFSKRLFGWLFSTKNQPFMTIFYIIDSRFPFV